MEIKLETEDIKLFLLPYVAAIYQMFVKNENGVFYTKIF